MKKNKSQNAGIISLFPAIIISSILLVMIIGVSQTFLSMLFRSTLTEDKMQSMIMAKSCLRVIIAKRIQNVAYLGGETINLMQYNCKIEPLVNENTALIIDISVMVGKAKSTDVTKFDTFTETIVSENIF